MTAPAASAVISPATEDLARAIAVRKKDGRTVAYRPRKILNDLNSAERVFGVEFHASKAQLVETVTRRAAEHRTIDSAELFRIVEDVLAQSPAVLAAFREYKRRQDELIAGSTDVAHAIARVVEGDAKVLAENGNKDARTFTTQREILAGSVTKAKGLQMLPADVRRAHIKGLIHVHDLDRSPFAAMPNCSLPNFEYLLSNGFVLGNARIEPPRSIGVAATLLVQLLGAISGEQYGGISIHEIDRLLEPYAEKTLAKNRALFHDAGSLDAEERAKAKTVKDIYDAMQAFEYQVNTLTTAAAQTPFTSISLGMGTSWCAREIQKAILAVREKGMSGETAIFPKILFFVDEGVNLAPGDPNYDVKQDAMRCSMRRIYPDLISVPRIREEKGGQLITPMGCRSFLHPWTNAAGEQELVGRNNLGVVSINLPRIAIAAEGSLADFFAGLDEAMDLTVRALQIREDVVLSADLDNAPVMYTQGGMGDPAGKTSVRDFYTGDNHKRSSISMGYIGVHNAMVALTGQQRWHDDAEHRALSRRILERMNARVDAAQADFHARLSVYATPSESLCDRFAELDRARFGEIAGVNDAEYYENSFHFPSHLETNPVAKIRFEAEYMPLTPGGFMYYVEAPNLLGNPAAFEAIWDEAFDHVGYFGINSPVDECFACGFEGEFRCDADGYVCPGCGNRDEAQASVTRRLCGYLGSPMKRPVVAGKQSEINARVKHM
ncbi:anaerobic ribonucleoside-triphosphate reductase [Corynebacterium sp.]|uniref:anaerobic ribonucleoside-triphosphate reductase n=1 Tax=Corynebacterium sp. TaxID=1720 RepID=UPI00373573BE